MKECWDKLCEPALLEHCALGATQNQNEPINRLVWKYCFKTDFSGLVPMRMATRLASLTIKNRDFGNERFLV